MEFAALNARLTEACTTRLGESVQFAPADGAFKTVNAVVERDVEFVGANGQVTDRRIVASFAKGDVSRLDGGCVKLAGEAEPRAVDAVIEDDGQMVKVALR